MANPMKIRAKAQGDVVEVRILMSHDMETGQRKNQQGEPIPAHFIKNVKVASGPRTVLSAQWGTAISKNPYLAFKYIGGKAGDKLSVTWIDNKGESRTDETTVS
jgi:sulfur-oxidizing protein SoxZ